MKKFIAPLLAALLLIALAGPAAAGRPMKPEDLYRIKTIDDPRFSPDGKSVAFTLRVPDLEENSFDSDIWIIPAGGGEPLRLTNSPEADHSPRWSPDGKSIAFISSRGGTPDLYLISTTGGEAKKLTSSETALYSPVWSCDGKFLLCGSRVLPKGKEKLENWTQEDLPECEARSIDRLLFRQWNRWLGDERNHLFLVNAEDGSMKDLTPFEFDVPPVSLSSGHDFDISPDGKEIAYVINTDPMPAVSTNHDIRIQKIEDGEFKKITGNKALDGRPRYSPDGGHIAYAAMERVGYESDRRRLTIYDRDSGTHTRLTEDLDRSVREILWAPGSKKIFFTARSRGTVSIYRSDLEGNTEKLHSEGYSSNIDISPDGKTLVFVRSHNHLPPEIYTMKSDGGKASQLTAINSEIKNELALPKLEEFWFTGAEETRVHGFLLRPPMFDSSKKYPVVLSIHGGPQGMWADAFMTGWFTFQLISSPGYAVVFINPRGSAGYGSEFREQVSRDYGGRCYRDLMAGLDYVLENYKFADGGKLAAIGGSFGGYSVNWIMGKTDRFDCLVSHAGLYNLTSFYGATEELWFPEWDMGMSPWREPELYDRWSPHRMAGEFSTPTLITHGQMDFRVPFCESLQLFTALQRKAVDSRLVAFPDEGHVISKPQNNVRWWREIHRWLEIYLKN